jgi:hypothetical protein
MPSYFLRNIDDATWEQFKAKAEKEGHPLRWVFLQLVQAYIDGKLPKK